MRMIVIAGMVVLAGCVAQPVQQAATTVSPAQATEARHFVLKTLQCSQLTQASCACVADRLMSQYTDAEAIQLMQSSARVDAANHVPTRISEADINTAGLYGLRFVYAHKQCNTGARSGGPISF